VAPDLTLREALVSFATTNGVVALHERLSSVDPLAGSRIDARNVRRVVRAIEVFERTGRPISAWQTKGSPDFEFMLYGIDRQKQELATLIDARVRAMFQAGFVDEVRSLLDSGLLPNMPAMSSIGYAHVAALLRGEISEGTAMDETARATRRLARRQAQWFRADDPRVTWVRDADAIEPEAITFTDGCTNVIPGESGRS
jgi:tRNA dimethylallyltransferase